METAASNGVGLHLRHVLFGSAILHTKDAARIHTGLEACQRLSGQLVPQLSFSLAAVKRWDSAGHDVNVHPTRAIPQTAALNKEAAILCDDELFLQRRFEQATINLNKSPVLRSP